MKPTHTLMLVVALAAAAPIPARAQTPAAAQAATRSAVTPIKIQVVISRFQGDKKISSLPYTLTVNSNPDAEGSRDPARAGHGTLRMGTKVPIASTTYTPIAAGGAGVNPLVSYQYQDVGTNIDCWIWPDDGRFRVEITIEDSSVFPDEKEIPGAVKGNPALRSFRASDAMLLKDGATGQFTTATDKVSGETVKVDVTLTVIK